jgi:hypothetical protein
VGSTETAVEGAIEEVRIYDRALSDGEPRIAGVPRAEQRDCNGDGINAGDRVCLATKLFDPTLQGGCVFAGPQPERGDECRRSMRDPLCFLALRDGPSLPGGMQWSLGFIGSEPRFTRGARFR